MAVRTTATAVIDISGTVLDESVVGEFLVDASLWVDQNLVGKGLVAAELEAIEKYLAAHFVSVRDDTLRIESDKTGQSAVKLEERLRFLNRAAQLDRTGTVEGEFGLGNSFKGILHAAKTYRGQQFGSVNANDRWVKG